MPQFVPEEWSREIRAWLLGRPESIDRLPLPAGRESIFELLCVVRLLDALHGPSGQIRLLGDGDGLAGIRLLVPAHPDSQPGEGDAIRTPCPSVVPEASKICQAAYVKAHRA